MDVGDPVVVTLDSDQNIYLGYANGSIIKRDRSGKILQQISPDVPGFPSELVAVQSLRIFVFYKEQQQFLLFDRFLTPTKSYDLSAFAIGFTELASLASDNNLWIFDQDDFSLKKIDLRFNDVLVSLPLDLVLDPDTYTLRSITEYQNQVYIHDENLGIIVFDNLGNFKEVWEMQQISNPRFRDKEIYFLDGSDIVFIDLYTRTESRIRLEKEYDQVLIGADKIFGLGGGTLEISGFIR